MANRGIAAEMRKHAEAAAEMVQSEYGHTMDFSEPTIGAVESLLNGLWKEQNEADRKNGLYWKFALLFGSYIGDLIRERYPKARWIDGSTTPDAPPPVVRLGVIDVSPIVWCFKRLCNGPVDGVVAKYLAFREAADERGHAPEPEVRVDERTKRKRKPRSGDKP